MKPRVIAKMLVAALLALLAFADFGCTGSDLRVSIESNTCWSAVFDRDLSSTTITCGNASFSVAGTIHCVRVTNQADTGYVRVRIGSGAWSESAVPRGTAEACH